MRSEMEDRGGQHRRGAALEHAIDQVVERLGTEHIRIRRRLDPTLFELNAAGALVVAGVADDLPSGLTMAATASQVFPVPAGPRPKVTVGSTWER